MLIAYDSQSLAIGIDTMLVKYLLELSAITQFAISSGKTVGDSSFFPQEQMCVAHTFTYS